MAACSGTPDRMVDMLACCLAHLEGSCWPEVAWRFSRLTSDGFPVEFGFSGEEDGFRVVCEVAGPECAHSARLDAGLALIRSLGLTPPDPALVRDLQAAQADGALQWGCWLGLRCKNGDVRVKLYIETPPGSIPLPPALAGSRPHMMGCEPSLGLLERYAVIPDASEARLRHVLRSLPTLSQDILLDAVERLIGLPRRSLLRWPSVGASIAEQPGSSPSVALFLRAEALRDGGRALLPIFARRAAYRSLLDSQPHALSGHGVLTLIPHDDRVEFRTNFSARLAVQSEVLAGRQSGT
jgi:hypothetical protein